MSIHDPIDLSWNDPNTEPGTKEATIRNVVLLGDTGQTLRSKAGDRMMKLEFHAEGWGKFYDYLLLEGEWEHMATRKLKVLGIAKGAKLIPAELIGRRVQIERVIKTNKKTGEEELSIKKYVAIPGGETPLARDPVSEGLPDYDKADNTPF